MKLGFNRKKRTELTEITKSKRVTRAGVFPDFFFFMCAMRNLN